MSKAKRCVSYISLLLLGMAGGVEAWEVPRFEPTYSEWTVVKDVVSFSSGTVRTEIKLPKSPTVIIGSMTWTLQDFISSGKLCEFRKQHLVDPSFVGQEWMKCDICSQYIRNKSWRKQ